jgi:hypothetical protein
METDTASFAELPEVFRDELQAASTRIDNSVKKDCFSMVPVIFLSPK